VSTADKLALLSLVVGIVALFVAAVSLVVAVYAIRKGNRNSSVATLVTITEAAREAWKRFLNAENDNDRGYELAELMNILEVGCAMVNERSLAGVSKDLLKELFKQELAHIDGNEYARGQIKTMMSEPHTFEQISRFKERLHDTPRLWYRIVLRCSEKVKAIASSSVRACLYK
jgi:hypothetical protein